MMSPQRAPQAASSFLFGHSLCGRVPLARDRRPLAVSHAHDPREVLSKLRVAITYRQRARCQPAGVARVNVRAGGEQPLDSSAVATESRTV